MSLPSPKTQRAQWKGDRERTRAWGRGGVKWNTVLLARQGHNTLGLTKAIIICLRFAQDWAQQHPIIAALGWGEELVGPHHFQRIYRQLVVAESGKTFSLVVV